VRRCRFVGGLLASICKDRFRVGLYKGHGLGSFWRDLCFIFEDGRGRVSGTTSWRAGGSDEDVRSRSESPRPGGQSKVRRYARIRFCRRPLGIHLQREIKSWQPECEILNDCRFALVLFGVIGLNNGFVCMFHPTRALYGP
jgi:hypothetical protein